MKICYFKATGNCLYVAKRIGGQLLSIPQLMRQEKIELADDAVGVVCPVYAGEMPMMVREFLSKAKIRTDYFYLSIPMARDMARHSPMWRWQREMRT